MKGKEESLYSNKMSSIGQDHCFCLIHSHHKRAVISDRYRKKKRSKQICFYVCAPPQLKHSFDYQWQSWVIAGKHEGFITSQEFTQRILMTRKEASHTG